MSDDQTFTDELLSQVLAAQLRVRHRRRRRKVFARAGLALLTGVGAVSALVLTGGVGESTDVAADGIGNGLSSPAPVVTGSQPSEPSPIGIAAAVTTPASPVATDSVPTLDRSSSWTELPTSVGGESWPGVFWTGSVVVSMRTENGGYQVSGEQWDPATNTSKVIEPSGLAWRSNPAMVWTGTEVLMVGGSNGPGIEQLGAAYNPATDAWRPIADPPGVFEPGEIAASGPGVWTGSEMLIWRSGLALDPIDDSWRTMAPIPLSERSRPLTVWTGSHLIVWGGCYSEGDPCEDFGTGRLSDGAMYSPKTDSWDLLPSSPLGGGVDLIAGWTGEQVVIVATGAENGGSAMFNPSSLTWSQVGPMPLSSRRFTAGLWTAGRFVVWGGKEWPGGRDYDDGAAFDPTTGEWEILPDGPGPGRSLHVMVETDVGVYVSAASSDRAPLLLQVEP